MKNIVSVYFLLVFVFTFLVNASFAYKKDSIIIITRPPTKERLAQIQARNDSIAKATAKKSADSSRFVTRAPKNIPEKSKGPTFFTVNQQVYGSFTDYITNYVKSYHANHGQRIARLQSSNRAYFKLIDNVMKRYNVPKEMKSLAIIESAMNCNAVSPVGAVGPWQFMSPTAKMMGLRVDETIDERRDFYKSTNAAARYLKKLHSMFNDWLLVIASYNCGPVPVLRAINAGKGRSFWDIKSKLPGETQNHVMAFIATSAILDKFTNVLSMGGIPRDGKLTTKADKNSTVKNNSTTNQSSKDEMEADENEEVKKPQFSQEELSQMVILKVKGTYNLKTISMILDEDLVKLKRWNPKFDEEIKTTLVPIHLRLPTTKLEKFIIEKDNIVATSAKQK
jgi:membrane-bound lytic murein transglycosylase D